MFTYVACRPSAKPKERIENFKERDLRFIYEQELDKTGLQHDMVDGGFKDLPRRVTEESEELLRDILGRISGKRVNKFARDTNHTVTRIISDTFSDNQQLLKELHNPIIRSFNMRKIYSSFKNNIWG